MKKQRTRFLAVLAASSLALIPGAIAAVITWDNELGGNFSDAGNWDNGIPGVDDDAVFDLNATYVVTFTENVTNNSLSVLTSKPGGVILDLAGHTYNLTASENSIYVNGGATTQLVVTDGTLSGAHLVVGDDLNGTLILAADSILQTQNAVLGNQDGSTGTVLIHAADPTEGEDPVNAGTWTNTGTLTVGNEGTGTLTIQAGGSVATNSLIVGNEGGSVGTVNVQAGSHLQSVNAVIGAEAGSTGVVTVTGVAPEGEPVDPDPSTWTNTGSLIVGDAGSGLLEILDGGTVSTNVLIVGNAALDQEGFGEGGTVFIDEDSSLRSNSAAIGTVDGSLASVFVEAGGTWINAGHAQVGVIPDDDDDDDNGNGNGNGNGGGAGGPIEGALVEVDGLFQSHTLTVAQEGEVLQFGNGVIIVSDGEFDLDDEDLPGAGLHVGANGGTGTLNIVAGGLVEANEANIGVTGTGTVNVDGEGSELFIDNDINIGNDGDDNDNGNGGGAGGNGNGNGNDVGPLETTGTLMVTNGGIVDAENIFVNRSGLLGGDGTIIGNVFVNGILAPGASIGTLTIEGNLEVGEGGVLLIEVDGGETVAVEIGELTEVLASDQVFVTGTATLEDGSVIRIVRIGAGGIQPGDTIIILHAEGGITADLEGIDIESLNTAFINWVAEIIEHDGDEFLALMAEFDQQAFDDFVEGLPRNLRNVAEALFEGGLFDILGAIEDDAARESLFSLIPVQHGEAALASRRTAHLLHNSFMYEMSLHRGGAGGMIATTAHNPAALAKAIESLENADDVSLGLSSLQEAGSWGGFIRGMGHWDRVDSSTGNADRVGHRARVAGVHGGIHNHLSPEFLLGVSVAYLNTDLDFRRGFGEGEIHTFRVGPYLSWSTGDFFFDASVTYGYHRNEIDRNVTVPAPATATSRYDAHDLSAFGQVGFDIVVFDRTVLTPTAGIEFTHLRSDSFRERGAGAANLDVRSQSTDSLRLRLGAKLAHAIDLMGLTLVPEVYAGWAHEFLDHNVDLRSQFLAGGPTFRTRTAGTGRNAFQIAAGASALVTPNTSIFVRYEGEFQSDRRGHGVVGGLNINF